mmetsp:Transcript_37050/g.86833  ORF Transcript_37050/g.86833 Transcript_37050/m.86833 type:complete len:91 (+) Transcript_37050:547-819(+)
MTTYEIYSKILKNFLINFNVSERVKTKNHRIEKTIKKFKYLERLQFLVNQNNNFFEFDLNDFSNDAFPKEIKWLFFFKYDTIFENIRKSN